MHQKWKSRNVNRQEGIKTVMQWFQCDRISSYKRGVCSLCDIQGSTFLLGKLNKTHTETADMTVNILRNDDLSEICSVFLLKFEHKTVVFYAVYINKKFNCLSLANQVWVVSLRCLVTFWPLKKKKKSWNKYLNKTQQRKNHKLYCTGLLSSKCSRKSF